MSQIHEECGVFGIYSPNEMCIRDRSLTDQNQSLTDQNQSLTDQNQSLTDQNQSLIRNAYLHLSDIDQTSKLLGVSREAVLQAISGIPDAEPED